MGLLLNGLSGDTVAFPGYILKDDLNYKALSVWVSPSHKSKLAIELCELCW